MENFLYKSDVDSYTQEESCTLLREEKRREERIATNIPAGFLLHISLAALPGQEDSDLCR